MKSLSNAMCSFKKFKFFYQTFFSSPLYLSATGNFKELMAEDEQLKYLKEDERESKG